jgi:hypothetical protein
MQAPETKPLPFELCQRLKELGFMPPMNCVVDIWETYTITKYPPKIQQGIYRDDGIYYLALQAGGYDEDMAVFCPNLEQIRRSLPTDPTSVVYGFKSRFQVIRHEPKEPPRWLYSWSEPALELIFSMI